jgi:hypothetical protein
MQRPPMVGYASRTGTRRNLAALEDADWRLLVSAKGELRTEGMRYAIDNGAWTAYQQNQPFDETAFVLAVDRLGERADWIVLPISWKVVSRRLTTRSGGRRGFVACRQRCSSRCRMACRWMTSLGSSHPPLGSSSEDPRGGRNQPRKPGDRLHGAGTVICMSDASIPRVEYAFAQQLARIASTARAPAGLPKPYLDLTGRPGSRTCLRRLVRRSKKRNWQLLTSFYNPSPKAKAEASIARRAETRLNAILRLRPEHPFQCISFDNPRRHRDSGDFFFSGRQMLDRRNVLALSSSRPRVCCSGPKWLQFSIEYRPSVRENERLQSATNGRSKEAATLSTIGGRHS